MTFVAPKAPLLDSKCFLICFQNSTILTVSSMVVDRTTAAAKSTRGTCGEFWISNQYPLHEVKQLDLLHALYYLDLSDPSI